MKYRQLGNSDLKVSEICLGTMTWGSQNNQADANEQLDLAYDNGINFIDTAEMYAIPPKPETYGTTEKIIGNWLRENSKKRKDIILATKIAGNGLSWIRGGGDIDGKSIFSSVNASLKRLQTDYIDLYQLHWPNRTSPHFGKHWPGKLNFSSVDINEEEGKIYEILESIDFCIKEGKIRHFGVSDDTPWDIHAYLKISKKNKLPRPISIQNEFNLLHTKDWPYLLELCVNENIGFLPWSPLAGGALTGKYIDGVRPKNSRWAISQGSGFFRDTHKSNEAVKQFVKIAQENKISIAQLALSWCKDIDGVSSTIIGATTTEQLNENVSAFELNLDEKTKEKINDVIKQYPSPY